MYKIAISVILSVLFSKSSLCDNQTLELVHVLFRHGDRTPDKIHLYPNDPHRNTTYASIGFGQVTNAGKLKLYSLGKALRTRYKTFLGPYTPETIDARSTDFPRTKMSLQVVLASLFPPEGDLVWKENFNWQPVAASYTPLKFDHVLGEPYRNCPRYRQLYFDFLNTTRALRTFQNYSKMINFTCRHSGGEPTLKSMFELYFTLETERENGLKLPGWTKCVYPKPLKNLVFFEYQARVATTEMKRLSAGFLLKKIICDTTRKVRGVEKRKMFLYSGHELNITYLLQLLGIYHQHVPPYGAYVLVEIHNVRGVRRIKVFYQDYTDEEPKRMQIPHCDFCTLRQFVRLYKKYLTVTRNECFENK